jgi:hypothetical protein
LRPWRRSVAARQARCTLQRESNTRASRDPNPPSPVTHLRSQITNLTADTETARAAATLRYYWDLPRQPGYAASDRSESTATSLPLLDVLQRGMASDIARVASFSALICANMARVSDEMRQLMHEELGLVYLLQLLLRTYDVYGQQAACLALANFAQVRGSACKHILPCLQTPSLEISITCAPERV